MKEEFLGYGCTINLLVHFILMFLSVHSGHSVLVLRTHINGLRIFIRLSALMTFWDISFLVVAFLNHFILYYVDLGRELLTGLFESNVNKSYFLHCSFKLSTNSSFQHTAVLWILINQNQIKTLTLAPMTPTRVTPGRLKLKWITYSYCVPFLCANFSIYVITCWTLILSFARRQRQIDEKWKHICIGKTTNQLQVSFLSLYARLFSYSVPI